jgi:hypothetical protein
MDHERTWLGPEEPVPDTEQLMIQSPKLMITIVWNPSGFHVVIALPQRLKFDREKCNIPKELSVHSQAVLAAIMMSSVNGMVGSYSTRLNVVRAQLPFVANRFAQQTRLNPNQKSKSLVQWIEFIISCL